MSTGQYLTVSLDYAKPLRQEEPELQPTVVPGWKLGPGVPIICVPLQRE